MALSRRAFVSTLGLGGAVGAGYYLSGGRLIGPWSRPEAGAMVASGARLLLHNNENPLGPGDRAIAAIHEAMSDPDLPLARYGFATRAVTTGLADRFGCEPGNILLGCGSTQILRTATEAFTSPERALVIGSPSYEECPGMAAVVNAPVNALPLTDTKHLDLDAMAEAAPGSGLVFLCNPNNPTATVHSAQAVQGFVDRVLSASPETVIVIDEAYHEYVTDPGYETQVALALENPQVIVARTFSKAFGMAGLRLGYAIGQEETLQKMSAVHFGMARNALALAAAAATLEDPARLDAESARNTAARQFTMDWFASHGYEMTDSQTNFIFVNLNTRTAAEFRDACAAHSVLVGRDFPPYGNWTRVSIGTMEEMQQAVEVFGEVLEVSSAVAPAA
jgi:histidinol-phosphate aminotransferase